VQASGDHYGRFDERTHADLRRLQRCAYPHLTVLADTLDAQQYQGLFAGAICLQPYGRDDYADKMSAVTFDALRSGAPIITVAGTTMAKIATDSGCGIVVDEATPRTLLQACLAIRQRYGEYSQRARLASAAHAPSSAWRPLIEPLELACAASGASGRG
jgi:hypothetical protein